MRVEVEQLGCVDEPYLQEQRDHALGMMLRPGSIEVGLRRSKMRMVAFDAGEMGLLPRHFQRWLGTGYQERLIVGISDAALMERPTTRAERSNSTTGADCPTRESARSSPP